MNLITRAVRWGTLVGLSVSGLILNTVMLLLVSNVLLRFIGVQILGLYELLTALNVVLLGFSLADSQREKQHVAINLLTSRFPRRVQDAVAALMTSFAVVVFSVVAFALLRYSSLQIQTETASELLSIPSWPPLGALIVGVMLLILTLLVDGYRQATAFTTGTKTEEIW